MMADWNVRETLLALVQEAARERRATVMSIAAGRVLDDLNDAEQRAERAEAELAALRERVTDRAWAFDAMGKHAHAEGLMDLLDDDTTGAASGEGEVADSCTYCASQIKQAQERRVKTEQECERLEDLRPKPGDSGYAGYAQMFNDITFAPIVTHLLFSDRGRMADALWAAGYRKTEGEK